jgi:hypothetical protein
MTNNTTLTNATASLNWTASLKPPSSPADVAQGTSLSSGEIFLALGGLALNAIQQRSGADEFPCPGSISLARLSPLICAADVLLAFKTLIYGLWHRLGFRGACALWVRNTRRHHTELLPPLDMRRMFIDGVVAVPAVISAITLFTAKDINARVLVWASMYMAAPVISGIARMAAENKLANADVRDFLTAGYGQTLMKLCDCVWCTAYACQFMLWISVFEAFASGPRFAGLYMNLTVGGSILVAVSLSTICKTRFYRHWSLRNWEHSEMFIALVVGFVLVLPSGMPTDEVTLAKWGGFLFFPLGAFSVVVNMLFLVTLLDDLLYYLPELLRRGSWTAVPSRERPNIIPEELRTRINPMLSTTPEWWRRTLMFNFACCQIIFAVIHFFT